MTVQPVTIRLAGRDPVPALLDHQDEHVLRLVMTTRGRAPVADRAVVEYTTRRGIHRFAGALRAVKDKPEIVELHRDGTPEVIQRRRYVRVDAVVGCTVRITDPKTGEVRTSTLDLSGGGMRLVDPVGFTLGQELDVLIELESVREPIAAQVRVVRDAEAKAKGVEIVQIAERDRERLIRFVTERERLALRMARDR